MIGVEATVISSDAFPANKSGSLEEQVQYEWIPPKKSIVQFFAEKVLRKMMLINRFLSISRV